MKKFLPIFLFALLMSISFACHAERVCGRGRVNYNNQCFKRLVCKNGGVQRGIRCFCPRGWTGAFCEKADNYLDKNTKCAKGFQAVEKISKMGNKIVVKCMANPCKGYPYTKCPTGYAASKRCMSGATKKYQCNSCARGYVKYKGRCYKKLSCKNGSVQKGNKCACAKGWTGSVCNKRIVFFDRPMFYLSGNSNIRNIL